MQVPGDAASACDLPHILAALACSHCHPQHLHSRHQVPDQAACAASVPSWSPACPPPAASCPPSSIGWGCRVMQRTPRGSTWAAAWCSRWPPTPPTRTGPGTCPHSASTAASQPGTAYRWGTCSSARPPTNLLNTHALICYRLISWKTCWGPVSGVGHAGACGSTAPRLAAPAPAGAA
jgi:hypothetical protein